MISLLICCMNWEKNLLSSIDSWIDCHEQVNDIIILDWSSSHKLYDNSNIKKLIHDKKINLVEVLDEQYFSMSKAYNLAYSRIAKSNRFFIKLDADFVLINNALIDEVLKLDNNFLRGESKPHYTGFFAIEKSNFLYYNENFNGWGYDDLDLYRRLVKNNIKSKILSNTEHYIYHIPHTDKESAKNFLITDKIRGERANRSISHQPFSISRYEIVHKDDNYEQVKRIC